MQSTNILSPTVYISKHVYSFCDSMQSSTLFLSVLVRDKHALCESLSREEAYLVSAGNKNGLLMPCSYHFIPSLHFISIELFSRAVTLHYITVCGMLCLFVSKNTYTYSMALHYIIYICGYLWCIYISYVYKYYICMIVGHDIPMLLCIVLKRNDVWNK